MVADDGSIEVEAGQRKRALGSTGWSVAYTNNETAQDTTGLIAQGGQQERASFQIEHDVTPGFRLIGGVDWRSINTDSQDIGSGIDYHFEASYGWNRRNSRLRSFEIAYVAELTNFDSVSNPTSSMGDSTLVAMVDEHGGIIDSDYHRHGAEFRWFGNYGKFEPYSVVGAYYRVDEKALEYTLAAGLDYDINPDLTIFLRGQYSSSGKGQNSNSGVAEGTVGVETSF